MEYDPKNGNLWCDYSRIWAILLSKYLCNDVEIKSLINSKMLEHFKIDVATPICAMCSVGTMMLEHFKTT